MNNESTQSTDNRTSQAMSFEEAMDKLEQLVRSMENGNTKLEDMIQRFVEARKLSAYCQTQLNSLKEKIEILTNDDPNNPCYQDFRHESENRADFIPGKTAVQPERKLPQAAQVSAQQPIQESSASDKMEKTNTAPQSDSMQEPASVSVKHRARAARTANSPEDHSAGNNNDEFLLF